MFSNHKLLITISKFRGKMLDKRPMTTLALKSSRYSNSPNIKFLSDGETNGCHVSFPLFNKLTSMNYGCSMSQLSESICGKCGNPLRVKNFCCVSCGSLQPPNPNMNYFQLLGVSQKFDINLEDLKQKFMKLQKTFHPDKFANNSKEELEISEEYSTLINRAYATLKNPLQRGFYLLQLQNIQTENLPVNQDFLLEIMEKNEELDMVISPKGLEKFSKKNQESIDKHLNLVKEAFNKNSMDEVSLNLSKLNYFVRLDSKIKEKLHKQSSEPS